MVRAKATLKIDHGKVRTLVSTVGEQMTRRAMERTVQRVKANISSSGRVDTGEMRDRVTARVVYRGLTTTAEVVGGAAHTIYQEAGTRGSVARPGGFLVFTPKGSNTVVFAKRTRGVTPGRFFQRALEALSAEDFRP